MRTEGNIPQRQKTSTRLRYVSECPGPERADQTRHDLRAMYTQWEHARLRGRVITEVAARASKYANDPKGTWSVASSNRYQQKSSLRLQTGQAESGDASIAPSRSPPPEAAAQQTKRILWLRKQKRRKVKKAKKK